MKFKEYTLAELAKIKYGKNKKKVESTSGKYPIYGTGGLMGYAIIPLYDKPSVLIGRKGTIDKVRFLEEPFWIVDTVFYTEINTDIVMPRYLYYALSQVDLKKYNEGTTIPSLRIETLNRLVFNIPNMEMQKKVLSIIEPIEEKVKNNRAINNNLEQQMQALFKSWFIDYMPFGGIQPQSWTIKTLGEVSDMSAGGDKPKIISKNPTVECLYPVYSNGLSKDGLCGYTNIPKIINESVTVSARGTIGFVCLRHIPYVPIVRLITLIPKLEIVSAKYLYLYLKQLNITGTGTTQQQLTVPDFKKTEISVPDKTIMDDFTSIVTPLFSKLWANEVENTKLVAMRDIILPKLMSGELDVSEITI